MENYEQMELARAREQVAQAQGEAPTVKPLPPPATMTDQQLLDIAHCYKQTLVAVCTGPAVTYPQSTYERLREQGYISRQEAIDEGLQEYNLGQPCKHGHRSPRLVSNHKCTGCSQDSQTKAIDKYTDFLAKQKEIRRLASQKKKSVPKVTLQIRVYPDCIDALKEYAVALNTASELSR